MSAEVLTQSKAKRKSIHAVVIRANGTVEDRGLICYYHWFPPLRWAVNAGIKAKYLYNKHVRKWQ